MSSVDSEHIKAALVAKFGARVKDFICLHDALLCSLTNKEEICEVLDFLRKTPLLQYDFLTSLCGVHYPRENKIAVIYHLYGLRHRQRLRIKVFLDPNDPTLPSITPIYPGANWMERETYDFYGVVFRNHPNLKRILNMDDLGVFPMRKEYALEDCTRTDKDDSQFGRTPGLNLKI